MFLATIEASEITQEYNPYDFQASSMNVPDMFQQPDMYSSMPTMPTFNSMQDLYDYQNAQMMYQDPNLSYQEMERNSNINRLRGM